MPQSPCSEDHPIHFSLPSHPAISMITANNQLHNEDDTIRSNARNAPSLMHERGRGSDGKEETNRKNEKGNGGTAC